VRHGVTEERKAALRLELDRMLEDARGQADHDCVVALSGGKDSAYLLYHLAVERKHKVLAAHVITPFESRIAEENIQRLKEVIPFDLETVEPGKAFYARFYSALFQDPIREGYVKRICYTCAPMHLAQCMKLATERRIPLIFLGVSPHQPDNVFFEWGRESIEQRDWIPEIFKTDAYDDAFREIFWDPHRYPPGTRFPRIIAPLHVMDYDTEQIMNLLSEKKIIPKRRLSPVVTNCAINWPMVLLDTKLLGHNPYVREFSAVVREGHTPRAFWRTILFLVNLQIKLGLFKRGEIKRIEQAIGIRFADCITDMDSVTKSFQEYP
jgi:hypothetical protein